MEYLPDFETLEALEDEAVRCFAPALISSLATMHDHGLVHGDLRAENVLLFDGDETAAAADGGHVADRDLYFIDATNVREGQLAAGRSYDLACALAVLAPRIGARAAVAAAAERYSPDELLEAREFLDFVNIRPDHDFDAATVKGEIEKRGT